MTALTVNNLDYGYFDENVIENINIRQRQVSLRELSAATAAANPQY